MKNTLTPANDDARWTSERWRAHVATHNHPAHTAASFALHSEEMGALRPAAKVIAALAMVGQRWTADAEPLSYEQAIAAIDAALAKRAAKKAVAA